MGCMGGLPDPMPQIHVRMLSSIKIFNWIVAVSCVHNSQSFMPLPLLTWYVNSHNQDSLIVVQLLEPHVSTVTCRLFFKYTQILPLFPFGCHFYYFGHVKISVAIFYLILFLDVFENLYAQLMKFFW